MKTIKEAIQKLKSRLYKYLVPQSIYMLCDEVIAELEALPNSKVSNALKEWLNSQDDKDRVITYQGNKTYSANDLIQEIDNQTDVGKELEQDIIALTIDLLFRGKEILQQPKSCEGCSADCSAKDALNTHGQYWDYPSDIGCKSRYEPKEQ